MFEHKQYLQSCSAESSMQTEILSFLNSGSLMPTKMAHRDYNKFGGLANHSTLGQLTNQSPSHISEGGPS